jgi:large subunit ribosomal protein L10
MTKEKKAVIIGELSEKFANTPYFYVTDATGMNAGETSDLRRYCYQRGVEYRIVKNTLIAKALETLPTDYTTFSEEVLKGESGIMFHTESGKVPAKLIKDFIKETKTKKLLLKGASVDASVFIGHDQLDTLINLKSRTELIADVVALLQSPAKSVLSALQVGGRLAGALQTMAEKAE